MHCSFCASQQGHTGCCVNISIYHFHQFQHLIGIFELCVQNDFDKALLTGLKEKLAQFPLNERRGIIMFDEIQISNNIDFRVDLCKVVGMVDFGELTSEENCYQEGDNALVFLFQPHMGRWHQTIGCFCSASTTPTAILSQRP